MHELLLRRFDITQADIREDKNGLDNGNIFLRKMREAKDTADHSRSLKIIEKERDALSEFRRKETLRMK